MQSILAAEEADSIYATIFDVYQITERDTHKHSNALFPPQIVAEEQA